MNFENMTKEELAKFANKDSIKNISDEKFKELKNNINKELDFNNKVCKILDEYGIECIPKILYILSLKLEDYIKQNETKINDIPDILKEYFEKGENNEC